MFANDIYPCGDKDSTDLHLKSRNEENAAIAGSVEHEIFYWYGQRARINAVLFARRRSKTAISSLLFHFMWNTARLCSPGTPNRL